MSPVRTDTFEPGRRRLFQGAGPEARDPIRPPWTTLESVGSHCTGCGRCVAACPQEILLADGAGLPEVDFGRGDCTFCGACAQACAEPVFHRTPGPAWTLKAVVGLECLARRNVLCQTCGDSCPHRAIKFRPQLGRAPQPDIDLDSCTGCGACVGACPVTAIACTDPGQLSEARRE